VKELFDWLATHQVVLWWLAGLSALVFIGTLVAIPVMVLRMRPDYFIHDPPNESWQRQHPVVRNLLHVGKNALGVTLVLAGILLSLPLVPGQGIMTVFIGLSLVDFPGKRALELRLARQRPVLKAINWIRARADRPPLQLPPRG
jgi:hypothetical protein